MLSVKKRIVAFAKHFKPLKHILYMTNYKEEVRKDLLLAIRNPDIYLKDILEYVEKNVEDAFNICCRKNLSVNEKYPDEKYKGQLGQKTVFLTVRMFDLWETALVEIISKHLKEKFPDISVIPVNDPIGDMAFKFPDGEEMKWEIKSSQATNSFTGATHSASKCNNYILINYSLDKDLKLKKGQRNTGFIKEFAVFIWDNMEAKWVGNPSKNNSFTSLRIPAEVLTQRPEIVVVGKIEPKKKWCKIKRKKLADSNNNPLSSY